MEKKIRDLESRERTRKEEKQEDRATTFQKEEEGREKEEHGQHCCSVDVERIEHVILLGKKVSFFLF